MNAMKVITPKKRRTTVPQKNDQTVLDKYLPELMKLAESYDIILDSVGGSKLLVMEEYKNKVIFGEKVDFLSLLRHLPHALFRNKALVHDACLIVAFIVNALGNGVREFVSTGDFLIDTLAMYPQLLTFELLCVLLMNGIRKRDPFLSELFIYLYRLYFRHEYNIYKKCRVLTGELLFTPNLEKGSSVDDVNYDPSVMMCIAGYVEGRKFSLDAEAFVLYAIDAINFNEKQHTTKEILPTTKESGLFEEFLTANDEMRNSFNRGISVLSEIEDSDCSSISDKIADVLNRCEHGDETAYTDMEKLFAAAYRIVSDSQKEEPSKASIGNALALLISLKAITGIVSTWRCFTFPYLLGGTVQDTKDVLFDTVKAGKHLSGLMRRHGDEPAIREHEVEGRVIQSEERISKLEHELTIRDRDIAERDKMLKFAETQQHDLQKRIAQLEQDREDAEDERFELARLREYVYNQTQNDSFADQSFNRDEIIARLKEIRVIVIGGHGNWLKRIQQLFPGWKYIGAGETNTKASEKVSGADFVYFYVDFLSHKTYKRIIRIVRTARKPCAYISNVNLDLILKQFRDDMKQNGLW